MDMLELWTLCSSNGIVLEKEQIKQLERYRDELLYWNEKVNLISRKDHDNILEKHILHSLSILKYLQDIKFKARVLDVGTGGGLPGIPLKIARPDIFITLVDSIKKKIKVTDMLGKHTGLRNISAICSRAEELYLHKEMQKNFDIVVSRSVAKISSVVTWVRKLIKPDTRIVFYKGGDINDEINNAKKQFSQIQIQTVDIDFVGYEQFKLDDKKIVICTFNDN